VLVYWARVGEGPADEGPANEGIADEGIAGVIGATKEVGVGVVESNSRKRVLKASCAISDKYILVESISNV
jgi:hypothetical protein